MTTKLSASAGLAKAHNIADRFYHSSFYLYLITAIGIWGFVFSREIAAIYIILVFAFTGLALCRDIIPFFIAVMIVGLTPLARHNQADFFRPLYYAPLIIIPGIIARILLTPTPLEKGFFFAPTLAVAISVTLGGAFFLSLKQYFSMPAMYYVIGLGFGMLFVYAFLEGAVPKRCARTQIDFFAKIMACAGVMGIIMILSYYLRNYHLIKEDYALFNFRLQWGNNLSNNLLITMPLTFYLASRAQKPLPLFVLGILQYFALMLSLSRGGMIFSIIGLAGGVAFCVYYAKGHRGRLVAVFVIMMCAFTALLIPHIDTIISQLNITNDESRLLMYKLAIKLFKQHPLFGTGLAYNPGLYYFPKSMCIYWYHSTLFQVLASLGLAGAAAYLMQFLFRLKALLGAKGKFNTFAALSFAGFAAYSMVNVGYFTPLPFVLILTMFFIMVERNNRPVKTDRFSEQR
jgi:O-antigen ligase